MGLLVAISVFLAGAIALPHLLALGRVTPSLAATIWFCALALRALAVMLLLVELILFFPATPLFATLTYWCWHGVIPLLATHLGLNGHGIGDAALLVPTFVLGVSLISLALALTRAARSIHRSVQRHSFGRGPLGSTVVANPSVLVAAAGLRHPQVIVSAGALTKLDDAELAAGVAHEQGHIARRHRLVVLAAQVFRSIGRWLPGADRALRELVFHLERDADRWAIQRHEDALALASAICKSASSGIETGSVPALDGTVLALSGSGTADRVAQLLDHGPETTPKGARRKLASAVALGLALFTLALTAMLPAAAVAGVNQLGQSPAAPDCKS